MSEKASNMLRRFEREGWCSDGYDAQALDRESDFLEDKLLEREYEYLQISIMLKRRCCDQVDFP